MNDWIVVEGFIFLAGAAVGVVVMACLAASGREAERGRARVVERPSVFVTGDLAAWCRANWDRVPVAQRRVCLDYLMATVPTERQATWSRQHQLGVAVGADEPGFHFGGGMSVRNLLRRVLPDDQLPPVVGPAGGYPTGEQIRNWDDFYTGALEELCEENLA